MIVDSDMYTCLGSHFPFREIITELIQTLIDKYTLQRLLLWPSTMLQELLTNQKAQASQATNEEVDLDELLDVS